jgi:hypothetical protein
MSEEQLQAKIVEIADLRLIRMQSTQETMPTLGGGGGDGDNAYITTMKQSMESVVHIAFNEIRSLENKLNVRPMTCMLGPPGGGGACTSYVHAHPPDPTRSRTQTHKHNFFVGDAHSRESVHRCFCCFCCFCVSLCW